eukprot:gb/GFBE01029079.1/.p1 GENE.gb/GFBE01029079.1/~~gb/GFBE01029079.1/.p1  ORF type:complete len:116 (+),score=9.40 gb/GFBE01029079.1/:1-348(+)
MLRSMLESISARSSCAKPRLGMQVRTLPFDASEDTPVAGQQTNGPARTAQDRALQRIWAIQPTIPTPIQPTNQHSPAGPSGLDTLQWSRLTNHMNARHGFRVICWPSPLQSWNEC